MAVQETPSGAPDQQLKKDQIGLFGVLVPGAAVMAPAASILFGVALTAGIAGSAVPLIFLIATFGMLATGNSLARLSHRWPSSGSFVTFISKTMGPRAGLFTGTAVLLALIVAYAGVYVFVGNFIAADFLHTSSQPWPIVCTAAFVLIALIPVVRGVEISIELSLLLLAIEIAVVVIVSGAIVLHGGAHGLSLTPFELPHGGVTPVALGFAMTVFLFAGFEECVPLAEESRDPRRNVPRALFISIIGIGMIYILSSWALVMGFGGGTALAKSADPLHDAAVHYAGWIAPVVRWILLSSFMGFAIAVNTAFSRVIFNTARAGLFPAPLARLTRWRTPAVAAISFGGVAVALGLVSKLFTDDTTIIELYSTAGTLILILMYILVNVALLIVWFRDRREGERGGLFNWVLAPVAGSAILLIPYYYNLKPGQAAPMDKLPIVLGILVAAAVAYVAFVSRTRPEQMLDAGRLMAGEADAVREERVPTAV